MQKFVILGALTALFFLFAPATQAQNAEEVERLRRENEQLKKENEQLKKENEQLKQRSKSEPDGASPKTGAKTVTKASLVDIDFELVKCVRDPKNPQKVIFTISAQCDSRDVEVPFTGGGFSTPMVILTARGGEELKNGQMLNTPSKVKLTRKVPTNFQLTYDGVDEDITQLDTVVVTTTGNRGIKITFHNIPLKSK
jgi:hypothetical protein